MIPSVRANDYRRYRIRIIQKTVTNYCNLFRKGYKAGEKIHKTFEKTVRLDTE